MFDASSTIIIVFIATASSSSSLTLCVSRYLPLRIRLIRVAAAFASA